MEHLQIAVGRHRKSIPDQSHVSPRGRSNRDYVLPTMDWYKRMSFIPLPPYPSPPSFLSVSLPINPTPSLGNPLLRPHHIHGAWALLQRSLPTRHRRGRHRHVPRHHPLGLVHRPLRSETRLNHWCHRHGNLPHHHRHSIRSLG